MHTDMYTHKHSHTNTHTHTHTHMHTQPASGLGLTFPVFAAVVIGGSSLSGGKGTVIGALLGALLLAELRTGLAVLGAGDRVQLVFVGTITIVAVALDHVTSRRQGRSFPSLQRGNATGSGETAAGAG